MSTPHSFSLLCCLPSHFLSLSLLFRRCSHAFPASVFLGRKNLLVFIAYTDDVCTYVALFFLFSLSQRHRLLLNPTPTRSRSFFHVPSFCYPVISFSFSVHFRIIDPSLPLVVGFALRKLSVVRSSFHSIGLQYGDLTSRLLCFGLRDREREERRERERRPIVDRFGGQGSEVVVEKYDVRQTGPMNKATNYYCAAVPGRST
jgi:hypothetical protein